MARTKEDAVSAEVAEPPKRGRGRPKGTGSGVKKPYVPTGRPRGRPKAVPKAPYTGKARGRPKGTVKAPEADKVEKRGKARKSDVSESTTPKKRGRRSKKDTESAEQAEAAVSGDDAIENEPTDESAKEAEDEFSD